MSNNKKTLPLSFKPILWSYDFSRIDPKRDKRIIIIQALNYGDLSHWQWLVKRYGLRDVRKTIKETPITEFRPRVRELVSILFSIPKKEFNYAFRGSKR